MNDIQRASNLVHEISNGLKSIPEPQTELYIVAPVSYNCEYGYDEYEEAVAVFDTNEAALEEVKRLDEGGTQYTERQYEITKLVLNKGSK